MKQSTFVLNLPFEEAAKRMKGLCRSELVIRFSYINCEGKIISVRSCKASMLYRDWYGACNVCPPNDACISSLHILFPNKTAADIQDTIRFDKLMDTIESVTKGR